MHGQQKATNSLLEYTLLIAFLQQQRAFMLCYASIACLHTLLVCYNKCTS